MSDDHKHPTKKVWKRLLLKYLDVNNDGVIQWYEIAVPLIILFIIQVVIEVVANIITQYIHI